MSESAYLPAKGDIIWLDLDPRLGHEQSGRRPAIVLSEKLLSERTGLAIICPITSKIKQLPFEIVLASTKTKGAILPIHLRSVDVIARQARFIEKAPLSIRAKTLSYLRAILGD